MPGRIRRAMDAVRTSAMKSDVLMREAGNFLDKAENVLDTAKTVLDAVMKKGIDLTICSVAGFDLGQTKLHIQVGGHDKDQGKDGEESAADRSA